MKKSKILYTLDVVLYGITVPFFTLLLLQKAFEYQLIDLTNTVLGDFLKEFTLKKFQNAIVIVFLCFLFFGSISYCLFIGTQRKIVSKRIAKLITETLITIGLAITLIILATLTLSELQLSIFTSWISFVALIIAFSKFSFNSNIDSIENDRDDEQCTQETIEK